MPKVICRSCTGRLLIAAAFAASFAAPALAQDDAAIDAAKRTAEALDLMANGDTQAALSKLDEALMLNPKNAHTHFWIAYIARQKAGEDPLMRQKAIAHLLEALGIVKYGDFAERCRALLIRLTGRPDTVRIFAVKSTPAEKMQDCTGTVLQRLLASAESGGRLSTLQDDSYKSWLPSIPYDTGELKALALDDAQRYAAGWLVFVHDMQYTVESYTVETKKGRSQRWRSRGNGQVTVADPIAGVVLSPFSVETNFLVSLLGGDTSYKEAVDGVLKHLDGGAWRGIMRTIRNHSRTDLADEMCFVTAVPGVYARSRAATHREAIQQPLLAVAPCQVEPTADEHAADEAVDAVIARILSPKTFAVVPPECHAYGLKSLHLTDRPGETGHLELCERIGAPYLLRLNVSRASGWIDNKIIYCKAYAQIWIDVSVLRTGSDQPILTTVEKAGMSSKRWGESNEEKLQAMLSVCTERVADQVAARVLAAIAPASTSGIDATVAGAPHGEDGKPEPASAAPSAPVGGGSQVGEAERDGRKQRSKPEGLTLQKETSLMDTWGSQ